MKTIAIQRLRLLPLRPGSGVAPKYKLILLSELASLGVRIANPELLDSASPGVAIDYHDTMQRIAALRGGDVDYVPLFSGFPNAVPDDDEYFCKRMIGFLGNHLELFASDEQLSDGTGVPAWLFALSDFGADPISQMQDRSLWAKAKADQANRKSDAHVEWIDFEFVRDDEVAARVQCWLKDCLYSKSSIKEALHADLQRALRFFGSDVLDFDAISMKENQSLFLQLLWQEGREEDVARLAKTPTDLLRLFAALTGSDVSLGKPITFPKLSRSQRRAVLQVLEHSSSLAEDLKRYKGLWLAVGRYLHPGAYAKSHPRCAAAFDALRNGRIDTFEGRTEALLADGELAQLLAHLQQRPGVLARKLHEVLRRFDAQVPEILSAFASVAEAMPVKTLLVLKSYFATINGADYRTVINKRGKIKVLPNNALGSLSDDTLHAVDGVLHSVLAAAIGSKESWAGKGVWIDPRLESYTVPLAQRAASDGIVTVGRGSRIPVDLDKVLRLFVYWKESERQTDLDLSALQFDADFKYAGHVSYTNLSTDGIVHSGDIQSAPLGAAEFMDVTLSALAPEVRYLAVQVYRYAGDEFAAMQCHAGWMVRTQVDASYQSFDIQTVQNKFDLRGTGGYCVPLIVDLQTKEIIVTDLYMGTKAFHNNVEGAYGEVATAAQQIAGFTKSRPTIKTLAEFHREARGALAATEAEADIRFGVSNCTFNATDVETLLAELL